MNGQSAAGLVGRQDSVQAPFKSRGAVIRGFTSNVSAL